jgi:hypothetical protein
MPCRGTTQLNMLVHAEDDHETTDATVKTQDTEFLCFSYGVAKGPLIYFPVFCNPIRLWRTIALQFL